MSASAQVNRPVDVRLKQEDVNRKLQLYGILSAFQAGKMPSNEQIDIALNSFLNSRALSNPSNKLSEEGRDLVADFRNVVEQAKLLLLTKNEGNLFQDFVWQCQQVNAENANLPKGQIEKNQAKQDGQQVLEGLRTLGTLIITNGQFRKLLNDAVVLLRDMAGDAATNAASRVKPSEDELRQIDEPAPENTWHDAPDFSRENIKNQMSQRTNRQANARDSGYHGDVALEDHQQQQIRDQTGVDPNEATGAAKSRAREARERSKAYLSKAVPQERRERTIWRLKKMIIEIQGHKDYNEAVNTILNLAENYGGHANTIGQQSATSAKTFHEDEAVQTAKHDLKRLIERFANNTSTDDLFDSINLIYRDADADPELKGFFKDVDSYIRKCLQQQGYITDERANQEWNQLYDRGDFLLRHRYRSHTDRLADELKFLGDQFNADPRNRSFAEALNKLFQDLGNDENGKPTFKPHLIKDLTNVILPAAFENVRYVPIPRIEYSDPQMDCVIENLVIEGDNLMPNMFEFASDNYFRWGRKSLANKNANSVTMSVSGVQMDLRDVSYYIKKKQGFPSLTDLGVMDIFLGGSGFSFKMKMSTANKTDRAHFFKVDNVHVDVKNFKIKVKQSKHKLLLTFAKPVVMKVIRPALQKVLEKQIKENFNKLDQFCYQIKQEADKAQQEALEDPENAPNVYRRYWSASQNRFMQRKEQKIQQAKEKVSDTKMNTTMTDEDSIFPSVKLPGGISTKATEYKELARKGNKWESPVFKIGSAAPTSNLPRAGEITRKKHDVTETRLKDRSEVGPKGASNIPGTPGFAGDINQMAPGTAGYSTGGYDSTHVPGTAGYSNGSAAAHVPGTAGYSNGAAATTHVPGTTGVPNKGTDPFYHQVDQALGTGAQTRLGQTDAGHTMLGASNPVINGNTV
ncbi:hypothetical protein F5884DRAFT_301727 [Xylogone sp. PMI_703]|nr:hypothetical protein F5884DRAFT_301727 [Xylogone sp. PMI_703]